LHALPTTVRLPASLQRVVAAPKRTARMATRGRWIVVVGNRIIAEQKLLPRTQPAAKARQRERERERRRRRQAKANSIGRARPGGQYAN
jgi:hypothetical protein